MTDAVALAYRACEHLTRAAALNFYYGIRLLPAPRRAALCAIYALARRIDDVADGTLPDAEKLRGLAAIRASLHPLEPAGGDPVIVALADACLRFPIPHDAFDELIHGAEMDVRGERYETFDDLLRYCRCVAGATGRLSLGVFEARDRATAEELADSLGVALQLTNILRDLLEDAARGRLYLPQEDLDRFGCRVDADGASGPMDELIAFEASRARAWFDRGLELLPLLDRRSAACTATIAGIYRRLLDRIVATPGVVLERRVSLPSWEKGWVAARSLAQVAR